jgi:ABC-type proline/glycine betaine transport system ATPase subunit
MSDQELANLRNLGIDFVFQFFNLVPHLTAIQNVLLSTFTSLRTGIDPKKRARDPLKLWGCMTARITDQENFQKTSPGSTSSHMRLLVILQSFLRTSKSETLTQERETKSFEYFCT